MSGGRFIVSIKNVMLSENILKIKILVKEGFNIDPSQKDDGKYEEASAKLPQDVESNNPNHGILNLRQCMQHFSFLLRVRCWSNNYCNRFSFFQFILSCRFFRLHCKHKIFNIYNILNIFQTTFWLGVCILNGNECINWRKYIYSQYNPYKKVSLYRKTSAVFIFYDKQLNRLKKSARNRMMWTIALVFELFDWNMNTKYI